jgi:hypothetical protein
MKYLLLAGIAYVALAAPAYAGGKDIDQPRMTAAVNGIPLKPHWRAVRIDKLEPNSVSLTVLFKVFPDPSEPEMDTVEVGRVVLKELVAEGKNPFADSTRLYIAAFQDDLKGETGQAMVRIFGSTYYSDDMLVWKPWAK